MSGEPNIPILTDTQRRIVGFSLTLLALFGSLAAIIAAFVVLGNLLSFFSGVIWPLAVAGVLALILRPVVDWAERRFHVRRLLAVVLLYAVFVLAVTGILVLMLPPLISQILDFIGYLPTLWSDVVGYVQQHYPHWLEIVQQKLQQHGAGNLPEMVAGQVKDLAGKAVPSVRIAFGGLLDAFEFVTHIVIIPVYLFFFLLLRGESLGNVRTFLPFLRPGVRDDVGFLTNEFVAIVESFFRGQLLIGCCLAVLYATGFTIVGLKFGLFIGVAVGLLNIVPYLGTILGLATALPIAFFQQDGGWHLVGLVVLVKIIVQCVESWILTPKIMGDRTGLHPAAIIFAIFFWGTAFHGVLGMLLAVPLTAFFVTVWRLVKHKYFQADHG